LLLSGFTLPLVLHYRCYAAIAVSSVIATVVTLTTILTRRAYLSHHLGGYKGILSIVDAFAPQARIASGDSGDLVLGVFSFQEDHFNGLKRRNENAIKDTDNFLLSR
jgi:hypothetical protein